MGCDNPEKAYIEINDYIPASVIDIQTDGGSECKAAYNLNGVKVNHPAKGIFIIDGKKVLKR